MRKRHTLARGLTALALAAALPIAACGDDDEESSGSGGESSEEAAGSAPELAITVSEQGKKLKYEVQAPEGSGVTKITLKNDGKKPHSAQLIGVEGDHTQEEVIKTFESTGEGDPLPDWFLAAGGVATTAPGDTGTVTQELQPGTYYAIDDENEQNIANGGIVKIEVSGEASDASLPEGGATVEGVDYGFKAEGLTAGKKQAVVFENTGKEPHHIVAAPIIGDAKIDDIVKFFKTEKGKPPVDFESTTSTSVIDGGRTIAAELELKKGRYALVCFISDRKGGPPHIAKGMISEATVE